MPPGLCSSWAARLAAIPVAGLLAGCEPSPEEVRARAVECEAIVSRVEAGTRSSWRNDALNACIWEDTRSERRLARIMEDAAARYAHLPPLGGYQQDGPPLTGQEEKLALFVNLHGHLCARPTGWVRLKNGKLEVTCVLYRGGTAKGAYVVSFDPPQVVPAR